MLWLLNSSVTWQAAEAHASGKHICSSVTVLVNSSHHLTDGPLLVCRIIGPDCRAELVDQNGLRKALSVVFLRLNAIAGLVVEFPFLNDTAPAPGTDGKPNWIKPSLIIGTVFACLSTAPFLPGSTCARHPPGQVARS